MCLEQSVMDLWLMFSMCACELFGSLAFDCVGFFVPLTFSITIPLPHRHETLFLTRLIDISIVPEMYCFGWFSVVCFIVGVLHRIFLNFHEILLF